MKTEKTENISTPLTHILRHCRERLSKCSLRGLEDHPDFRFYTYPEQTDRLIGDLRALPSPICLTLDAPPLSFGECHSPLVLLDATWRLAMRLFDHLNCHLRGHWQLRSLPAHLLTAYPRCQRGCPFSGGLASIEALAAARQMLRGGGEQILIDYRWRDEFLNINRDFFKLGPRDFSPARQLRNLL